MYYTIQHIIFKFRLNRFTLYLNFV